MAESGYQSDRAEHIAARATRPPKRRARWNELLPQWEAEVAAAGVPAHHDAAAVTAAVLPEPCLLPDLTDDEIDTVVAEVPAADGPFMARPKVFGRTRLVAEVSPYLYGRDPEKLDYVLDRILGSGPGVAAGRDRVDVLSPPLDVMLGLRAVTVGAHRADAEVVNRGPCSGRLADVLAVRDVVGVGVAAEQDGSTWWAQPPVRSGGWVQGGITSEQQSTPTALLGSGAVSVGFESRRGRSPPRALL